MNSNYLEHYIFAALSSLTSPSVKHFQPTSGSINFQKLAESA